MYKKIGGGAGLQPSRMDFPFAVASTGKSAKRLQCPRHEWKTLFMAYRFDPENFSAFVGV